MATCMWMQTMHRTFWGIQSYESFVVLHMQQLLLMWNNHWWGVEIAGEMSQLSERCDGHKMDMIEGAVIAARKVL